MVRFPVSTEDTRLESDDDAMSEAQSLASFGYLKAPWYLQWWTRYQAERRVAALMKAGHR
jgi:hypothetical protein